MSSCVFFRSAVENEKKRLCKELKTGRFCWVSHQICQNHLDWLSIGTNYRFCLLYMCGNLHITSWWYSVLLPKTVVINIIRWFSTSQPSYIYALKGHQTWTSCHHPKYSPSSRPPIAPMLGLPTGAASNMKYCCENTISTEQLLRISRYKPNTRKSHTCLYCMIISYH